CIVDVIAETGDVRRAKVACRDPAKAWACDLLARAPVDLRPPHLIRVVLETKRSILIERVPEQSLVAYAQSAEHLRALVELAPPLLARGELLGIFILAASLPSRPFGAADVRFAEELARVAALSIENARLDGAARAAVQAREDVLGVVGHDLRNLVGTVLLHAS